jgi:hypothetical protein
MPDAIDRSLKATFTEEKPFIVREKPSQPGRGQVALHYLNKLVSSTGMSTGI